MKIRRFNEEASFLPVLDMVIDNTGKVIYNSVGLPVKGTGIERAKAGKILNIKGEDGGTYLAGIDKNGNLEIKEENKENNKIKFNGKFLLDENNEEWIAIPGKYKNLISTKPTGWVNAKIDMEVAKRVRRYSNSIETPLNQNTFGKFLYKIESLSEVSLKFGDRARQAGHRLNRRNVQKEMSLIILLHYLNEIKTFFTPSASGFIFESYLAGFIDDSIINDNNTAADIVASNKKYQIKLYGSTSSIEVTQENIETEINGVKKQEKVLLDYYVIGIKNLNEIEIFIINTNGLDGLKNNKVVEKQNAFNSGHEIKTPAGFFSIPNIKKLYKSDINQKNKFVSIYKLDLSDIDGRIKNLGKKLKHSIDNVYTEISKLQYNIETLLTGVDENNRRVEGITQLEPKYKDANTNIVNLSSAIEILFSDIKGRRDRRDNI